MRAKYIIELHKTATVQYVQNVQNVQNIFE